MHEVPSTELDAGAEFDRQVRGLVEAGFPSAAGLGEAEFRALVTPLREQAVALGARECDPAAGRVPFVLVLTREVVAVEEAMRLTVLRGGREPGFVDRSFEPGSLERFTATKEVRLPGDPKAYLLVGVERGEEFCGVVPQEALDAIAARGRTALTIEEGIALLALFPQVLVKNKCFSLGGSRCGDRRVPAIWISRRAPKLGWCWVGNPHTWLGMASAAGRRAAG
ncbi:DUF5701 family protein [Actinocorallia populi]|uniref:DUF5701 family protein n=1 Tax=Actinocorallia populi TaxID=2079200 RepID=UPI001E5E3629|nr:DUF5701 family protein [Actinocorallia populi]